MSRLVCVAALLMLGAGVFARLQRRSLAQVPLRQLTMRRERWTDRRVRCRGRVESFADARQAPYFVLDDDGYRVALEGLPAGRLDPLRGREAVAVGTFGYREGLGNFLQVESLTAAGDTR